MHDACSFLTFIDADTVRPSVLGKIIIQYHDTILTCIISIIIT